MSLSTSLCLIMFFFIFNNFVSFVKGLAVLQLVVARSRSWDRFIPSVMEKGLEETLSHGTKAF